MINYFYKSENRLRGFGAAPQMSHRAKVAQNDQLLERGRVSL